MTDVTRTHHIQQIKSINMVLLGMPGTAPVSLKGKVVTIGRSQNSDIVIPDRYVSSHHCQISERRGAYHLRDLGSRNGTLLNGVRVDKGLLWPGARLGVGRATLLCSERHDTGNACGLRKLVGKSAAMRKLRTELASFAVRDTPVLIEGESGTGKELAASAIHELSARARGPFVSVNCGALTPELATSELFGHERGAFTGAAARHHGAFEQAHGGTLFLDEVGELDTRLQAMLLRVLETRMVRRVGAEGEHRVDARLVTATNRDLLAAVEAKSFRLDLFHRLAVLRLRAPALRERMRDLPELAQVLLERLEAPHKIDGEAIKVLAQHRWPGNVRELRNVLERACALAPGTVITRRELRFDALDTDMLEGQAAALLALVAAHGGSTTAAARALGIPRTTLRDRLRRIQHAAG